MKPALVRASLFILPSRHPVCPPSFSSSSLPAPPPHVILEVRRTDGIQEWARTDGRQHLATCCLSAHGPRMGEDPGIVILATIPPSEIISMSFTGSPPSRRSVEDDRSGTGPPLLLVILSACPPHVILEVRRTDGIQEWARTDGGHHLATHCLSAHGPRMGRIQA